MKIDPQEFLAKYRNIHSSMILVGNKDQSTGKTSPLLLGGGEACVWFSSLELYSTFMKETKTERIFIDVPMHMSSWLTMLEAAKDLQSKGVKFMLVDLYSKHAEAAHSLHLESFIEFLEQKSTGE